MNKSHASLLIVLTLRPAPYQCTTCKVKFYPQKPLEQVKTVNEFK